MIKTWTKNLAIPEKKKKRTWQCQGIRGDRCKRHIFKKNWLDLWLVGSSGRKSVKRSQNLECEFSNWWYVPRIHWCFVFIFPLSPQSSGSQLWVIIQNTQAEQLNLRLLATLENGGQLIWPHFGAVSLHRNNDYFQIAWVQIRRRFWSLMATMKTAAGCLWVRPSPNHPTGYHFQFTVFEPWVSLGLLQLL